jgi:hypothetical protein
MSAVAQPAMRPRRPGIWAVVALATAAVLVVPAGARYWLKAEIQDLSIPAVVYQRPISQLVVSAPAGEVRISQGRAGQVTVAGHLDWAFSKPVMTASWHGQTLQVGAHCASPNLFEDCQAIVTIEVPPGTPVRTSVGSGSADVTGLTGPMHLTATSGSIEMTNVSGPVFAAVTSGSISAPGGLGSARLDAQVASGGLSASFDSPPSWLSVSVGSGAATLTVPQHSQYRIISAVRGAGVLRLPGRSDQASVRSISARVGAGVLLIGYPLSRG